MHNADYAKIQESADGELVEMVNPENDMVYWDMPVSEWVEKERHDFCKVSDEAVDDPVSVVNRAVRILSRNDINELSGLPMDFAVDLRYAREQVEVTEKEGKN